MRIAVLNGVNLDVLGRRHLFVRYKVDDLSRVSDRKVYRRFLTGLPGSDGGEGHLRRNLQVVECLRPRSRFAHLLHGGHEQPDEDRDNCDHDEQFN